VSDEPEFKQALVDVAEFVGHHVAPVDRWRKPRPVPSRSANMKMRSALAGHLTKER
jgi:hypothetical protein